MPMDHMDRTFLFVPGNRPERFDKALAAGASAVIIDLEDAVPAAEKAAARAAIAAWLSPDKPVLIRVNSADTAWFAEDISLAARPGVAGIVLPKSERIDDINTVMAAGAQCVLPLIESAHGMANAAALAAAPGVLRLLFGTIDFNLDLGIEGEDDELLYFRSHLVLVSRVAGIAPPVDGVTTAIDDVAVITHDTERGRRLGFGGKLCIHPKQVSAVNACFMPTGQQIDWAKRVLDAAAAANGAAIAVDGRMVDRPVILKAQGIIAEVQRTLKR